MGYKKLLQEQINKTLSSDNPYIGTLQTVVDHKYISIKTSADSYWGPDNETTSQTIKGFLNTQIKDNKIVTEFAPYQAEFLYSPLFIVNTVNTNDIITAEGKSYVIVGKSEILNAFVKLFLRQQ